jgi:hypothetical protein
MTKRTTRPIDAPIKTGISIDDSSAGFDSVFDANFPSVDTEEEPAAFTLLAKFPKVLFISSLCSNAFTATTEPTTNPRPIGVEAAPKRNRERGGFGTTVATFDNVLRIFIFIFYVYILFLFHYFNKKINAT